MKPNTSSDSDRAETHSDSDRTEAHSDSNRTEDHSDSNRTENHSDPNRTATNWAVEYDAEPISIRDPVAEALAVLDPGEPLVITYADAVTAAGHSCPTAAGAFRIAQMGLDELYPSSLPVRSEIEVLAAGPADDPTYGVMSRLISFVTGAAREDGFGGLAGDYGARRGLLTFDAFDPDGPEPTFRFRRTDTGETVDVSYHVGDLPAVGPAAGHLEQLVEGTATESQRREFAESWHGRLRRVLEDDSLFTVTRIEP